MERAAGIGARWAAQGPLDAEVQRVITASRLFRGIALERLLERLRPEGEITLRAGAVLLQPGERNASIYLLVSGRLALCLDDDARIALAHVEPGQCIGEISVIDDESTLAAVVALEPSRLLVIPAAHLWDLMTEEPVVAVNLVQILAERTRRGDPAAFGGHRQQAQLRSIPDMDPVTGLHNRRWLNDMFVRRIDRCARAGMACSAALVDVDRFQAVTASYGQQAGGRVLAQVARIMVRQLRPSDLIARCGGEQFAVLLPETSLQEALAALERVRHAIGQSQTAIAQRTTIRVSVSIGIAQWRDGFSLDDLVQAAGRALDAAKRNGRNCSMVAETAA